MALPKSILESAERVLEYHRSSKLDDATPLPAPDRAARPAELWEFGDRISLKLPREWIDLPSRVIPLLRHGLEEVDQEKHSPPQDLKTLSTWLYLAAGARGDVKMPWGSATKRATGNINHSSSDEIYVAAFSIAGIPHGFYQYNYKTHSLIKLREANEALAMLRRGRPDLQFLSQVPCAVLVSSVFARSSWIYGKRGYRLSLIDAGQVTANLHAVAMGLGMICHVRIRMTDAPMRELIGLRSSFNYPEAESVQSMIVWSDEIQKPQPTWENITEALPPIARNTGGKVLSYGSILAAHADASSVSVAIRDVRPPLTDLTPVPPKAQGQKIAFPKKEIKSQSISSTLSEPIESKTFTHKTIPKGAFNEITQCAFRGGTFFPLKPDGPHTALVRPFWVIHQVDGFSPGIWWYDPVIDRWSHLNRGEYSAEVGFLMRRHHELQNASAVCVMVSNLKMLMGQAGPDLYRLAHIEAGVAAQRLRLASNSLGLACNIYPDYADDLWRNFLGLGATGWEVITTLAIGGA